jgi:hypothetical protein
MKQGDVLLPLIFNIASDYSKKKVQDWQKALKLIEISTFCPG